MTGMAERIFGIEELLDIMYRSILGRFKRLFVSSWKIKYLNFVDAMISTIWNAAQFISYPEK